MRKNTVSHFLRILVTNVQICTKNPTRTTVSQYATEVCSRAAQVDTELSGRGYMSSSNDRMR